MTLVRYWAALPRSSCAITGGSASPSSRTRRHSSAVNASGITSTSCTALFAATCAPEPKGLAPCAQRNTGLPAAVVSMRSGKRYSKIARLYRASAHPSVSLLEAAHEAGFVHDAGGAQPLRQLGVQPRDRV